MPVDVVRLQELFCVGLLLASARSQFSVALCGCIMWKVSYLLPQEEFDTLQGHEKAEYVRKHRKNFLERPPGVHWAEPESRQPPQMTVSLRGPKRALQECPWRRPESPDSDH